MVLILERQELTDFGLRQQIGYHEVPLLAVKQNLLIRNNYRGHNDVVLKSTNGKSAVDV